MIRNHSIFTYTVMYEQEVMVPDPEAPGGGEMVRSGQVCENKTEIRVIAETRDIADAWLHRPFSGYRKLRIVHCTTNKINAFIESHTW